MAGRRPKPTTLKVLAGNPGNRPLNGSEPTPEKGIPECPHYLDDVAKQEWERTARLLCDMRVLTLADAAALEAFCVAYSRWRHAEDQVRKYGAVVKSPVQGIPMKSPYLCIAEKSLEQMRKFLIEFGLTPASRTRIKGSAIWSAEDDELDRFCRGA